VSKLVVSNRMHLAAAIKSQGRPRPKRKKRRNRKGGAK
jgi:hypothetical protein